MQFLANIGGWGDSLYYLVVPFLFVLTIVVFFHELGHFLVARWCGIRVQVFSIGFGRELLGFTDRHGTRWKLAAIPLGGYVKFVGDENAASMPDRDAVDRASAIGGHRALAAAKRSLRASERTAAPVTLLPRKSSATAALALPSLYGPVHAP